MRADYRCEECGVILEVTYAINHTPDVACEKCKKPMTRVYMPTPFVLKGAGWPGKEGKGRV